MCVEKFTLPYLTLPSFNVTFCSLLYFGLTIVCCPNRPPTAVACNAEGSLPRGQATVPPNSPPRPKRRKTELSRFGFACGAASPSCTRMTLGRVAELLASPGLALFAQPRLLAELDQVKASGLSGCVLDETECPMRLLAGSATATLQSPATDFLKNHLNDCTPSAPSACLTSSTSWIRSVTTRRPLCSRLVCGCAVATWETPLPPPLPLALHDAAAATLTSLQICPLLTVFNREVGSMSEYERRSPVSALLRGARCLRGPPRHPRGAGQVAR